MKVGAIVNPYSRANDKETREEGIEEEHRVVKPPVYPNRPWDQLLLQSTESLGIHILPCNLFLRVSG